MRESDLIDSYPRWVQYYAPLLNDLLGKTYRDIPLTGTAGFLADFGPRVAASFDLAPEDVDQLATHANLNAWAKMVTQFFNSRDAARKTGRPLQVNWQPEWFKFADPQSWQDLNSPISTVEDTLAYLVGDPEWALIRPDEYGQIVTAMVGVLQLYSWVYPDDDEYDGGRTLRQHKIGPDYPPLPGDIRHDRAVAREDEARERMDFAIACTRALTNEICVADEPGVLVHADAVLEARVVLFAATDNEDVERALAIDQPAPRRAATWIPQQIDAALAVLKTVCARIADAHREDDNDGD
jgi:hypothetical protein